MSDVERDMHKRFEIYPQELQNQEWQQICKARAIGLEEAFQATIDYATKIIERGLSFIVTFDDDGSPGNYIRVYNALSERGFPSKQVETNAWVFAASPYLLESNSEYLTTGIFVGKCF